MKRLLLLSVLLLTTLARASQKTIDEYWQDVGLSFSAVEPSFETQECYKAERSFLACVHALTTAASLENLTLTTKERLQAANPGFGAIKADFGAVLAVEPARTGGDTPSAVYKQFRADRAAVHQFWTRLYQNRSVAGDVDFVRILGWVKASAKFNRREPILAALVLNTYLGVLNDPHTMVLPLQYVLDEQKTANDSFMGIGARFKLVRRNGKSLIVLEAPLEASPALKAGLRPHDILTQVDGVDVDGDDFPGAIKKIKGKQGSTVVLTINRQGQTLKVSVIRDVINIPNVASKMVTAPSGKKLAYVKFASFMKDQGCETLGLAIADLERQGAQGVVLDLRENGGGLLTQAVCVANLFLPANSIVSVTKSLTGAPDETLKTAEDALTNLPTAVLINSRSASASEIVAGALQDHRRAWLVGERTYGKGSVQTQRKVNQAVILRQTVARFYLPSGRTNQVEGVFPDFVAFSGPNPSDDDKVAYREEDEYMALAPVGTPWTQPRAKEVALLAACAGSSGKAEALFKAGTTQTLLPDYQLFAAEDVLGCVLASPKPATSSGFEIGNARTWGVSLPFYMNFFNLVVPGIGVF